MEFNWVSEIRDKGTEISIRPEIVSLFEKHQLIEIMPGELGFIAANLLGTINA